MAHPRFKHTDSRSFFASTDGLSTVALLSVCAVDAGGAASGLLWEVRGALYAFALFVAETPCK